jgi:hypothetical protein
VQYIKIKPNIRSVIYEFMKISNINSINRYSYTKLA